MDKQAKAKKKLKVWQWALLIASAAALAMVVRYAWMFWIDPMSAFRGQLATPTPQLTANIPTQAPTEKPSPSPALMPTPAATPTAEPTLEPTPEPTPSEAPTPVPELDLGFMKNRVNILILGWDESPERNEEGSDVYRDEENNFRSDVIMLLTVNFKTGRVDLISVPRDTLAAIYKDDGTLYSKTAHFKVNAAFAKGGSAGERGFHYAMQTVSKLFGGVPLQYYAGVNMAGLKAVVDAMGGVDYDVDVRIELNGRVLEKGYQHLNGQQVLDYCRARKGISTDIGRTDRQQRMLFAIFSQLQSRDQLKNFINIYHSIKGYISTNLSADQIATMASFAVGLDMDDLHRKTLSGEYVSSTPYNKASFYCLDNGKLVELVKRVFGVTIVPDPKQDAAYVLADKAAADGRSLAAGADYLTELVCAAYGIARPTGESGFMLTQDGSLAVPGASAASGSSPVPPVVALNLGLMTELSQRLMEACSVRPNNDENQPYPATVIEQLSAKLTQAMQALCQSMGYTQATLDSARLPAAFYKLLPKE